MAQVLDGSNLPTLSLFNPDAPPTAADPAGLSPRTTLSQFFERWYLPVVLMGQHNAKAPTIGLYRDALRWWAELTGDPPLQLVDEYVLARFQASLRQATYKRSRFGRSYPLAESTQAKHLRCLRSVLYRTGPTINPKRPGKCLVEQAPYVHVPACSGRPKQPFTIEQVRQMIVAAEQMQRPVIAGISPGAWWQAALALFFYTGQRYSTLINKRLTWDKLHEASDGWWLHLERDDVAKTGKAQRIALHDDAMRALAAIKTERARILPFPYGKTAFDDWHQELQQQAGIETSSVLCKGCAAEQGKQFDDDGAAYQCPGCGHTKLFSPHTWRRTHGVELALTGLNKAVELARESLNHSDVRTTLRSYVNVEAHFLRKLPSILPAAGDARQLTLF